MPLITEKTRLGYAVVDEAAEESSDHLDNEATPASQRKYSSQRWNPTSILVFLLLTCVVTMGILVIALFGALSTKPEYNQSAIWTNNYIRQTFEPIAQQETEEAFRCLPNGNGLVYLTPEMRKLANLPPGLPSGDRERNLYGMGFAHQLYCLATIRSSLLAMMTDQRLGSYASSDLPVISEEVEGELHQCIDYLRQKIMCAADLTLEYPTGEAEDYIDGYGIEQTCAEKVSIPATRSCTFW